MARPKKVSAVDSASAVSGIEVKAIHSVYRMVDGKPIMHAPDSAFVLSKAEYDELAALGAVMAIGTVAVEVEDSTVEAPADESDDL